MEIFILSIFIFLSLFSILGFGKLFEFFFFQGVSNIRIGLTGFLGLFLLSSISYVTHFFTPHNYLHNSILLLIGTTAFIFFIKNGQINFNKNHYIIFLLLIIAVVLAKSHDDFGYYHLPNALHFTQNKLEFGLGNLNHGFKHHSSIFYLYSVFFLPYIKFYLFNVLNFFFLLFSAIFLYDGIIKDINKKKFDTSSLVNIIFLILFITVFNRIGEYGTDITGQLLAGILICISLEVNLRKKFKVKYLLITFSIFAYLVTIKTYFIVYILFPLMLVFLMYDKINILKELILTKLFFFLLLVGIIFILINISATGCIIYPVANLCFPNYFSWGLKLETVNYLSNWYEIWSKAGAGPDFREQDPLNYIKGFNWFYNWIDKYFFTKVTDFLLAIFTGLIFVFFSFRENLKLKYFYKIKKNLIFYFIIQLLFILWFLKFPSLRYGGYILILTLIVMPFSFIFSFDKVNYKKVKKNFVILLSISILIFLTRNVSRLNKEFSYSAVNNFDSFPFFYVKKINFVEEEINNEKIYIPINDSCWATPTPCLKNTNKDIIKRYTYRFYLYK